MEILFGWCLLIECIFPLEFNRLGRNFPLLWWLLLLLSSFSAVGWFFAWRRLKNRMNRAAAIGDLLFRYSNRKFHFNNYVNLEIESKVIRNSKTKSNHKLYDTQLNDVYNCIDRICVVHRSVIREQERRIKNEKHLYDDGRSTTKRKETPKDREREGENTSKEK